MGLFGKQLTPQEQWRSWKLHLRSEMRKLERQIMHIEREEQKVKRSIRETAKAGQRSALKILAIELVRSKKAKERLHSSRAQMNSVMMAMQAQMAQQKVAQGFQKSAEIMSIMQDAIKLPEIHETMMEMGKEMTRAGIIEEMLDDVMDTVDDEDIEEQADEEVDKILDEILGEQFARAGKVATTTAVAREKEEEANSVEKRLAQLGEM